MSINAGIATLCLKSWSGNLFLMVRRFVPVVGRTNVKNCFRSLLPQWERADRPDVPKAAIAEVAEVGSPEGNRPVVNGDNYE